MFMEHVTKAVCASAVAVLATASSATGQINLRPQIAGIGIRTCAQFAQDYGKDTAVEHLYWQWTLGWLSAEKLQCQTKKNYAELLKSGAESGGQVRAATRPVNPPEQPPEQCPEIFVQGFGADEQMQFLRSYCARNPLKGYTDALWELSEQIRARQGLPTTREIARSLFKQNTPDKSTGR
jgi:hypothetical protein